MEEGGTSEKLGENKFRRINPSFILCTLVNLLKNSISCQLFKRHELLLDDLISSSPNGFYLHDLFNFNQLMQEFIEKWEVNPNFPKYMKKIIKICAFPPLACRSNDILYTRRDLTEYFSTLGYLLVSIKDNEVKLEISSSVRKLLNKKKYKPESPHVNFNNINEALGCSKLPSLLVDLLEICEDDLYQNITELCILILEESEDSSISMLEEDALNIILTRLEPNYKTNIKKPTYFDYNDFNKEIVDKTLKLTELFIKVLENLPKEITKGINPLEISSFWGLRFVLQTYVVNDLKVERNYCMCLILKLLQLFPGKAIQKTGIVQDICILCAATELGTGATWASTIRIEKGSENYDFKRALMLAIPPCLECFGSVEIIKETNLLSSFLRILDKNYHHSWLPEELITLRCTSLLVLERIMSKLVDDFIKKHGVESLVMYAKEYLQEEYFSFNVLILYLNCILSSFGNLTLDKIKNIRNIVGIKAQLREILVHIKRDTYINCVNQKAFTIIFNTLTRLIYLKEDLNPPIEIEISASFLKRFLNPRLNDSKYTPDLAVAILYHIWELGKMEDEHFQKFVELKGTYLVLDLIKGASFPIKLVGLGLLVDMCEEGSCLPYLLTWRSEKKCLLSLLLNIFDEENTLIGVAKTSRGVITDFNDPIAGNLQKQNMNKNLLKTSACITDLEGSCRPKIFALTQLIQKRYETKTNVANDYYKIYGYNLTVDDKICKILCDNFLIIKIGEMWKELELFFAQLDIAVAPFDKTLIDTMAIRYENIKEQLEKQQNQLIILENKNEKIDAIKYYELIREAKFAPALKAFDEIDFFTRVTDACFRETIKNPILDKRTSIEYNHRTAILGSVKMNMPGQKIWITSDLVINPMEELPPIPVSPCNSHSSLKEERFMKNSQISLDLPQELEKTETE